MSRRNPRRAAAAAIARNLLVESEDEHSSDNEIDLLQIFQAVLQRSMRKAPKKRAPKKSKSPKATTGPAKKNTRGGRRGQQAAAPSTVTAAVNLESDNEHIDEEVKVNQLKDIENKVDTFFKSSSLLSDDDDDELDIVKSNVKQPPKESKEFYSLSDSDEDKPSTSKLNSDQLKPPDSPIVVDKIDIAEQSKIKGDELMEIVDQILDGSEAPIEIDAEPDNSWANYKSKTEEILGSMNAILDEFKENLEEKKPEEKVVEKSPLKAKPTCPICLEVLGSDVTAAATLCGHIFCLDCIQKVAKTSKTCPTCRKRINLKQIHPIYL